MLENRARFRRFAMEAESPYNHELTLDLFAGNKILRILKSNGMVPSKGWREYLSTSALNQQMVTQRSEPDFK
jgi:hypothetical protein